jgi:hypothetical protein
VPGRAGKELRRLPFILLRLDVGADSYSTDNSPAEVPNETLSP